MWFQVHFPPPWWWENHNIGNPDPSFKKWSCCQTNFPSVGSDYWYLVQNHQSYKLQVFCTHQRSHQLQLSCYRVFSVPEVTSNLMLSTHSNRHAPNPRQLGVSRKRRKKKSWELRREWRLIWEATVQWTVFEMKKTPLGSYQVLYLKGQVPWIDRRTAGHR